MDPATIGILLAAGLTAQVIQQIGSDKAKALVEQSRDAYGKIDVPALRQLAAHTVGPSAEGAITADPQYRAAQLAALAGMKRISDSGGMTLEDEAAQNQALDASARQESAGRHAIEDRFAARGATGSGQEMAASLANQQGAADRGAMTGMATAAAAQKRYFDALRTGGQMAGQAQGQDFDERSRAARARDMIDQYNANAMTSNDRFNTNQREINFNDQRQHVKDIAGTNDELGKAYNADSERWANGIQGAAQAGKAGLGTSAQKLDASGNPYATEPSEWNQYTSPPPSTSADGPVQYDENGNPIKPGKIGSY